MQIFDKSKLIKKFIENEHLIKYKCEGQRIRGNQDLTTAIDKLVNELNNNTFTFMSLKKSIIHGKTLYSFSDLRDFVVAKIINYELSKAYEITLVDRDKISKQLAIFLQEKVNFTVYKFDVANFYESIDLNKLLMQINTEQLISLQSTRLINKLLNCNHFTANFLPRGLPISSTLSEIFMQHVDNKISNLVGVYHYIRYVDDIIIFVHNNEETPINYINDNVKLILNNEGLSLNPEKYTKIEIKKKNNKTVELEYLGYQYTLSTSLKIRIAERKISRFKRRIYYTIKDYCKTKDIKLLIDRLRFLSGNYYVFGAGKLLAGIRYNYKLLKFDICEAQQKYYREQLIKLDKYLHSILKSKALKIDNNHPPLHYNLHNDKLFNNPDIAKLSFLYGYDKTITHQFQNERISIIKKVWRHDKK